MTSPIILRVNHYTQCFNIRKNLQVNAVNNISFFLRRGEVFGLIGESGCGKSTLARAIAGDYQPTSGRILFNDQLISERITDTKLKQYIHRHIQLILQDSSVALNPKMTIAQIIAEPLIIQRLVATKHELHEKITALLSSVGMSSDFLNQYPQDLSGGQRQRVNIARSLAVSPQLIIADEPIASLDVSIQAQIVSLFKQLQKTQQMTFLFIAHDLAMVRYLSDRVGVMYRGKLVEIATTEKLFTSPLHPYTQSLLSAMPIPDPIYERQRKFIRFEHDEAMLTGELQEVEQEHFVLGRWC